MKRFVCIVVVVLTVGSLILAVGYDLKRDECTVLREEVVSLKLEVAEADTACDLRVEGLAREIKGLKAERDELLAALKIAADALEIEHNAEAVDLTVFREKLVDVEKRLERCKIDRDNLYNEKSAAETEVVRLLDELGKKIEESDRDRAIIEAQRDAIQRLDGDVNCLREELRRAQSCLKCHRSHK